MEEFHTPSVAYLREVEIFVLVMVSFFAEDFQ